MSDDPAARYTVTDYLLDRLAELGADRLFGVPGDFTLGLLDHVEAHPSIQWTGTANELGAGYAADGYARMRGIGALCTTFGVGELSAINAVAGSFAEHVPVVHIVGAPSRAGQESGRALHHSLGDGDFRHFFRMSAEVTAAQAALTPENACTEIDRVLLEVRERRLPGYILVPTDVGEADARRAAAPLPASLDLTSAAALASFTEAARWLLAGSAALDARPVAVLADLLVHRMGASESLHRLLDAGHLPHATLLWGRRVVDESSPQYLGTYVGAASEPAVREGIEGASVLILAGVQSTDLTSGFFSQHLDASRAIRLDPHAATVAGEEFGEVDLADALDALAGILGAAREAGVPADAATADSASLSDAATTRGAAATGAPAGAPAGVVADSTDSAAGSAASTLPATAAGGAEAADPAAPLSQAALWDAVAAALQPGDLVLADQGTSFYGMGSHRLPHDVVFIGQPLWASIGYTLPALLGAALAAPDRRPVLLIGDGAAPLTAMELGTMIRLGLAPIVVVVNNDGYTVERAIHGPAELYNDIAPWDWTALPAALARGASGLHAERVTRAVELRDALASARANTAGLSLIEAVVPRLDVPPLLSAIAAAAAAANARVTPPAAD